MSDAETAKVIQEFEMMKMQNFSMNEFGKTVWIENNEPWAAKFSDADFINYKTDKLANFLKEINESK